jgi:hypothetical protein
VHLDFESQWFLMAIIAMLVVGLPLIAGRISLPAQLQFQEVPPDELTPRQAEHFDAADEKLKPLGYHPLSTFRAVNLKGANLSRVYTSTLNPARILVTLLSSPRRNVAHNYAEIISRYRDGAILTTKNSGLSSVFARMPEHIVKTYPGIDDLAELKARHDTQAASMTSHGPLHRDDKTFFADFNDYHKRFCEYQRSRGLLRLDKRAGVYHATVLTGLRGIRNFLNPLADNFTVPRFALGVLLGAALPVLVAYGSSALVDWLHSASELDPTLIVSLLLAAAFTLGGLTVGYLFQHKSFIWAFLLGYIPTKLLRPASGLELWFCVWMALVAHYVAHWRMRRARLV